MEDLQYIVNLGFSGADLPRAVIITFFLAMFLRKDGNVWQMAALALLVDRLIWPIIAMALAGADIQSIYASIGALAQTLPDDLGLYLVRFMGLGVMIAVFTWARRRLHELKPMKGKAKPAAA